MILEARVVIPGEAAVWLKRGPVQEHMAAIEGRQVELIPLHLTLQVSMVSTIGQEGSRHYVIRLSEFADGRFFFAVIVNESHCPTARYIGVLGRGLRSRGFEAQRAEARIAVNALNRMAELGLPRAERVA